MLLLFLKVNSESGRVPEIHPRAVTRSLQTKRHRLNTCPPAQHRGQSPELFNLVEEEYFDLIP
jgi:hypothetical protein